MSGWRWEDRPLVRHPCLHFAFIDGVGLSLVTPADRDSWGAVKRLYR